MAYVVQLKDFEGPLDLLLHLISRAKVNIRDIFVSEITEQYLQSIEDLSGLDMDAASEFLQMAATLLVNPRPTGEEYVKYSFPSKTMEYMSTGTPVLTTVLPGMPKEYHPYVYLLEEETADAIAEKLGQIFAQPAEALFEKGMAAREFILKEKNNVKQAGKILAMLERDGVQ